MGMTKPGFLQTGFVRWASPLLHMTTLTTEKNVPIICYDHYRLLGCCFSIQVRSAHAGSPKIGWRWVVRSVSARLENAHHHAEFSRSVVIVQKILGRRTLVWGTWPLKEDQSMFWPPKMSHFFIQNCSGITLQVSRHQGWKTLSWKERKTNFSMHLRQFHGLTWLTLTPVFYDR